MWAYLLHIYVNQRILVSSQECCRLQLQKTSALLHRDSPDSVFGAGLLHTVVLYIRLPDRGFLRQEADICYRSLSHLLQKHTSAGGSP